jgi:hypothetical protein
MADAAVLNTAGATRAGSNPAVRTTRIRHISREIHWSALVISPVSRQVDSDFDNYCARRASALRSASMTPATLPCNTHTTAECPAVRESSDHSVFGLLR